MHIREIEMDSLIEIHCGFVLVSKFVYQRLPIYSLSLCDCCKSLLDMNENLRIIDPINLTVVTSNFFCFRVPRFLQLCPEIPSVGSEALLEARPHVTLVSEDHNDNAR